MTFLSSSPKVDGAHLQSLLFTITLKSQNRLCTLGWNRSFFNLNLHLYLLFSVRLEEQNFHCSSTSCWQIPKKYFLGTLTLCFPKISSSTKIYKDISMTDREMWHLQRNILDLLLRKRTVANVTVPPRHWHCKSDRWSSREGRSHRNFHIQRLLSNIMLMSKFVKTSPWHFGGKTVTLKNTKSFLRPIFQLFIPGLSFNKSLYKYS